MRRHLHSHEIKPSNPAVFLSLKFVIIIAARSSKSSTATSQSWWGGVLYKRMFALTLETFLRLIGIRKLKKNKTKHVKRIQAILLNS